MDLETEQVDLSRTREDVEKPMNLMDVLLRLKRIVFPSFTAPYGSDIAHIFHDADKLRLFLEYKDFPTLRSFFNEVIDPKDSKKIKDLSVKEDKMEEYLNEKRRLNLIK